MAKTDELNDSTRRTAARLAPRHPMRRSDATRFNSTVLAIPMSTFTGTMTASMPTTPHPAKSAAMAAAASMIEPAMVTPFERS